MGIELDEHGRPVRAQGDEDREFVAVCSLKGCRYMHEPDRVQQRFCAHPFLGVEGARRNRNDYLRHPETDGGIVRIYYTSCDCAPRWCPRFKGRVDCLRRCEACDELYDPRKIWIDHRDELRDEPSNKNAERWCFTCNHMLDGLDASDVIIVEWKQLHIYDGQHIHKSVRTRFGIGAEKQRGDRGFGGRKFVIRFLDGKREDVTTTNLWSAGNIPSRLWDRVHPTAEFVEGQGGVQIA